MPTMILTALGVDLEGRREVLAFRTCAEGDKDGWSCLLQDLRSRGVTEVESDCDGWTGWTEDLVSALSARRHASAVSFTNGAMP